VSTRAQKFRVAKLKSRELNDTDLELWALKLEMVNQNRPAKPLPKPLFELAVESIRANQSRAAVSDSSFGEPTSIPEPEPPTRQDNNAVGRYISSIR
jgi:hypothetical protein